MSSYSLRLNGVGRAADDGEPLHVRVIELYFNRKPTDEELRSIHDHMRCQFEVCPHGYDKSATHHECHRPSKAQLIDRLDTWARHLESGTGVRNSSTRERLSADIRAAIAALQPDEKFDGRPRLSPGGALLCQNVAIARAPQKDCDCCACLEMRRAVETS